MYVLKILGLSLDLLGQLVMAYFERLRSMWNHSAYLCSLFICASSGAKLFFFVTVIEEDENEILPLCW